MLQMAKPRGSFFGAGGGDFTPSTCQCGQFADVLQVFARHYLIKFKESCAVQTPQTCWPGVLVVIQASGRFN